MIQRVLLLTVYGMEVRKMATMETVTWDEARSGKEDI